MNILRGEIEVSIGGKPRLVKFGTNQLAIFTQMHKVDLSEADFGMHHLRDLIYSALVAGAKKNKETVDFDEWEVGEWIDELPDEELQKIVDSFTNSLPKGEGDDTKKK
jgi:hypothetical protein